MRRPRSTPTIVVTGLGSVEREPERFLGKRGHKFLPPGTRYALAAAQLALDDAGLAPGGPYAPEERGVFMGTNFAVHAVVEAMDDVVLNEGAQALLAVETPNFSVNLAASYISQRWGFLAFNVTLTDMLVAGLEALSFAAQSLRDGRARLALAGAAEGPIPADAAALLGGPASDGAGCLLALETAADAQARGARAYARLGYARQLFVAPETLRSSHAFAVHESRLRRALDEACAAHGGVRLALSPSGAPLVERLNACACEHVGARQVGQRRAQPERMGGAHASAAPLLWLAQALRGQEPLLLLAASPQGHVVVMAFEPVSVGTPPAWSAAETARLAVT